MSQNMYFLW